MYILQLKKNNPYMFNIFIFVRQKIRKQDVLNISMDFET